MPTATYVGQIATGGNATANQSTLALTTTAEAAVGSVLFLLAGTDNVVTVDGDNTDGVYHVEDTASNIWYRVRAQNANEAGSQTATCCTLYVCTITSTLASGGTITLSLGGNATQNDAQCAIVEKFSVTSGHTVVCLGVTGLSTIAGDPAAITLSGMPSVSALWIHGFSAEARQTDSYTWDADYTQFTLAAGDSGGAATSQSITGGYRLQTATSDTVDVTSTTADRDYAQLLACFLVVDPTASGGGGVIGGPNKRGGKQ